MKWSTEQRTIDSLIPYEHNPRQMTEKQNQDLTKSLETFDLVEIPAINTNGVILAGHQRLRIMQALGRGTETIDVRVPDRLLTEKEVQEYNIRSNKNTGEFDFDVLANAFDTTDLLNWGFDEKDLKIQADVEEDEVPEPPVEPTTKLGGLFQLGNHRLLCGDATKQENVERLMDGKKADMVFTDPPYNVNYSNADRPKASKTDLGIIRNDKMEVSVFKEFISDTLTNSLQVTKPDASLYLWYASASASAILTAFDESGWKRTQEIIWKKPMLLGRSRYQWAHEPCIFAVKGQPFFIEDRTKTTVWDIGGYDKSKNDHPTQKPVRICSEGVQNSSKQEDIVLDLFGGSGSTLIACEQLNRSCYMMELDPKYCDVIIQRWENLTGEKAVKL